MSAILGLWTLGLLVALVVLVVRGRETRRGSTVTSKTGSGERIRRGGANALLVLEEFVAPRVEHVIEARQQRRVEDDQGSPGDGPDSPDEASVLADLRASLGRSPIDPDEVRRQLSRARRAGLDWSRLFDAAIRAELAERPYRAPALPPRSRVAPFD